MRTAALVVIILIAIAIAVYVAQTPEAPAVPGQPKAGECSVTYQVEGTPWTFEGTVKYDRPRVRLEGVLSSESGAVDILIISDGTNAFLYGTLTPLTKPGDVRWYDATGVYLPMMRGLERALGQGALPKGITCAPAGISESDFGLPEDAVLNAMPAGGIREYY